MSEHGIMSKQIKGKAPDGATTASRGTYWAILLVYGVVLAVGFTMHEMWRDEYEQLLFRRYAGIIDTGSPFYILYNFLCWFSLQINDSVASFKTLHFSVALGIAAIVLWRSPFPLWQKGALLFSYFLLYEFSIIARYYGLITLLVFGTAVSLVMGRPKFFTAAILMLATASLNPISATFAAGFAAYIIALWFSGELNFSSSPTQRRSLIASVSLLSAGAAVNFSFFVLYVMSPEGLKPFQMARPPLPAILPQIWNAYIPIPDITSGIYFWWSNIFPQPVVFAEGQTLGVQELTSAAFLVPAAVSIAMLAIFTSRFSQDRPVMVFYLFTTALQLSLIHFALKVYVIRYLGILFITLVTATWLFEARRHSFCARGIKKQQGPVDFRRPIAIAYQTAFALVLVSQVIAGVWAYAFDATRKFSNSEDLAAYVQRSNLLSTHVLAGYVDAHTQCIAAETGAEMYFPQIAKFGRFAEQYNPNRRNAVGLEEVLRQVAEVVQQKGKPVVLVMTMPISTSYGQFLGPEFVQISPTVRMRCLTAIDEPVISKDEVYWVYEIKSF